MKSTCLLAVIATIALAVPVMADDETFSLTIKDHTFSPAEITIPAGKKVKLLVTNQDASAEEFESFELKREKVIAGNSEATIFLGPLEPGEYPFMGEFHSDTAKGKIIAK